ncbi:hypothetical protein ACFQOY_05335 [Enterococcus alcedinis]|uniref:Lactococcin 972 family bacteriocin n=1 Tax=Enterococcus alcedinis TaxID=1274384 RepID=A0A917N5A5_9ENTE|nr:hypothetical protein [Enterococcus alcedinis]MBP2103074.1 hypothetical protein [Enterococcus alcedinis]GGI66633.1 hypothetical protein GCM10011482_22870 [Enterococcus alcedinis]
MKKGKFALLLLVASMTVTTIAFAATYQHPGGRGWARNTENWHMLSYFGEAYAHSGGVTKITYTDSKGVVLGTRTAQGNADYKSITVYDSLNPFANKTEFYCYFY